MRGLIGGNLESFDIDRAELLRALAKCDVFASVESEMLAELAEHFTGVRLTTDETLMVEGDVANDLYVVRHGRLRATVVASDGSEPTVGEIGKNEVVGEMGVITNQERSATVRATRDTDLFRLPADAFARVVQGHPEMLRPFTTVLVDRLRTAMTRPTKPSLPATIVIVMLADADPMAFAHNLAQALTPYTTAVVNSADSQGREHVAGWLLDIENDVDLSILVADREPTEWTRRCLRHADHIELIIDGSTPVKAGPIRDDPECAARLDEVPIHLVTLHEPDATPATARWLPQREFASYVNLLGDSQDEIVRLARLITGRANVLVLGGGGARGFAHFGVARALRERDIPIDGIVGTSAGAVVGAMLARFPDVDEAQELMLDWFESVKWHRDFTPPQLALTSGRFITEGLQSLGGGYDIEDLSTGFAAISCDLVSAAPFVHDRGPLWQAIRASGSVPGLFPPVLVGDRLLVDGGLVANMPTEIARYRHPNATLIAVDVGDPAGIVTGSATSDGVVSGWDRLRRKTVDDTVTLPRVLMRLTELGRQDSIESADVAITPDVRGFGITATQHAREIVTQGEIAGRAALDLHLDEIAR